MADLLIVALALGFAALPALPAVALGIIVFLWLATDRSSFF